MATKLQSHNAAAAAEWRNVAVYVFLSNLDGLFHPGSDWNGELCGGLHSTLPFFSMYDTTVL